MKIRTFFYTIKQGFLSIFRNKWFTIASLATIASCLFVFGIFFCIAINIGYSIKSAEEGVAITVFFDEGISTERIEQIGDLISHRPEVAKYEYISADEAWESFSKELGENAEGFTENPLQNSANYQIYLSDVALQNSLVEYLEGVEGVRRINKSDIALILAALNAVLSYIFLGMTAILLAVSVFLISNTVTIGISVRKEEITIMKYIGATDYFVRAPFVYEGMALGLVGSLIPMVLIYYLYVACTGFIDKYQYLVDFLKIMDPLDVFSYLLPVAVLLGVGIGFCGSFFTVRKHLRV